MRHLLMAVVVVASGLGLPGQAADTQERNYLHIVDWSGKEVVVVKVGEDLIASRMSLADQPYLPYGVTFGNSVESNCGGVSFVTQGPLLRVLDHTLPGPRATLNVEQQYPQYELTALYLRRLEANRFSASDGTEFDLLYVVGERILDAHEPWLLVFDETALLAEPMLADSALVAAAPLCEGCYGIASNVAVRDPVAYSGEQEAFASVLLQTEPELYQRLFRVVLHEPDPDHEDFWLEVSRHPTPDDDIPLTDGSPSALGLDYGTCEGDQVPFAVLKASAAIIDLSTNVSSCPLNGSPNDVVVSSPSANLANESYHFVVTEDGANGYLLGFPVGGCPNEGTDSIEVPIVGYPRASALVSETSDAPWIYAVGVGTGIAGVHLEFSSDVNTGDQITVLESFVIGESGHHTAMDSTWDCPNKSGILPPTTPWDDPCDDPDNDDPHCDPKPSGGDRPRPVDIQPT
jgi:hypothetical protein